MRQYSCYVTRVSGQTILYDIQGHSDTAMAAGRGQRKCLALQMRKWKWILTTSFFLPSLFFFLGRTCSRKGPTLGLVCDPRQLSGWRDAHEPIRLLAQIPHAIARIFGPVLFERLEKSSGMENPLKKALHEGKLEKYSQSKNEDSD